VGPQPISSAKAGTVAHRESFTGRLRKERARHQTQSDRRRLSGFYRPLIRKGSKKFRPGLHSRRVISVELHGGDVTATAFRDGKRRFVLIRRDKLYAIAALAVGVERRTQHESQGCNRRAHPSLFSRSNPDPPSKSTILTLLTKRTLSHKDRPS
jgi:hypothetical protein